MEAHYGRNENQPVMPQSVNDAISLRWQELPLSQSVFHARNGRFLNRKFVSPDGRREAVYDKCGNLVTDNINMGTHNFSPPWDGWGHFWDDVLPYYAFGNSVYDRDAFADRTSATFEAYWLSKWGY